MTDKYHLSIVAKLGAAVIKAEAGVSAANALIRAAKETLDTQERKLLRAKKDLRGAEHSLATAVNAARRSAAQRNELCKASRRSGRSVCVHKVNHDGPHVYESLPEQNGDWCLANTTDNGTHYACTRAKGHTGPHAFEPQGGVRR